MRRLKVLTWHTHGSYLHYLSHAPHDFHVLTKPGRPPGYGGRCGSMPWRDNVHELPVERARHHEFDCILFQDDYQWEKDQYGFLTPAQRALPRIYLEHDPPLAHPTDTRHPVDDPGVLLVHVTPFNALMWDSGRTPVRVIEHGVPAPHDLQYSGELARGVVVTNHLGSRTACPATRPPDCSPCSGTCRPRSTTRPWPTASAKSPAVPRATAFRSAASAATGMPRCATSPAWARPGRSKHETR